MRYKILYILFFISYILLGGIVYRGVASPRVLMAYAIFFVIIREHRFCFDKYIGLFIAFVFFYGLSSLYTGYIGDFISKFFRLYLIAYTAYAATKVYVKKYRSVDWLIYIFVFIGLLDAVVTIGQFYSNQMAITIPMILNPNFADEFEDTTIKADSLSGFVLPGLFTYVVNGYYLSIMCIMALFSKDKKIHWWNLTLWMVIIYALFLCQERTAFVAGLFLSLFAIYRSLADRANFLFKAIIITGVTIGLVYLYEYMIMGNMRYAYGFEITGRSDVWGNAISFIKEHFLLGGHSLFVAHNTPAHNLFLNSFIYGGLFGAILIFILIILQFKVVIKYIIRPYKEIDPSVFFFSLAFIAFTLNSFNHNLSVVSGEGLVWILWAVIYQTLESNNIKEFRGNENCHHTFGLSR